MKDVLLGMVLGATVGVMACSCPKVKRMVNDVKQKVESGKECCCSDTSNVTENSPKTEEWQ